MGEFGPNLETRLFAKLRNIFEYPDRVIRDAVYTALVAADGDNNEDVLTERCIDALLLPPTPVAAKRPGHSDVDSQDVKRVCPGSSEGGSEMDTSVAGATSSFEQTNSLDSTAGDTSGIGADLSQNEEQIQAELRRQNDTRMILDMFPWIQEAWLAEQVGKEDFNKEVLIDYVLTNSNSIPKKEKPKPQPPAVSTSKAEPSTEPSTAQPAIAATASVKDYLNDYAVPCYREMEINAQLLSSHFHMVAVASIRHVLRCYNNHLAPAFNVLQEFVKNLSANVRRGVSLPLTVAKDGNPGQIAVKLVKCPRRHIPIWFRQITPTGAAIPPEVLAEIAWLEKQFNTAKQDSPNELLSDKVESSEVSLPTSSSSENQESVQHARERGEMFECGICYDEFVISQQMVACTEGHLFCIGCLRNYAREAIYGQTKTDLLCMEDGCSGRFLHDMLVKALDADNVRKLEEKRMNEALNIAGIEGLERCKYCNYAVIFDVGPEIDKVFKCGNPACDREYCRLCFVDWEEHIGRPCKEVETEDDTRSRRDAEERMAAAVIRNCSRCKAPLIKEEGCNKLTCSCGAMMCYMCRQTIRGYDHFCQHVRDPGKSCQMCKNCSLWEDPKLKDAERVKEIQTEVKQKLADTGKNLKVGVDDSSAVAGRAIAAPVRVPAPAPAPIHVPAPAPAPIPAPVRAHAQAAAPGMNQGQPAVQAVRQPRDLVPNAVHRAYPPPVRGQYPAPPAPYPVQFAPRPHRHQQAHAAPAPRGVGRGAAPPARAAAPIVPPNNAPFRAAYYQLAFGHDPVNFNPGPQVMMPDFEQAMAMVMRNIPPPPLPHHAQGNAGDRAQHGNNR